MINAKYLLEIPNNAMQKNLSKVSGIKLIIKRKTINSKALFRINISKDSKKSKKSNNRMEIMWWEINKCGRRIFDIKKKIIYSLILKWKIFQTYGNDFFVQLRYCIMIMI